MTEPRIICVFCPRCLKALNVGVAETTQIPRCPDCNGYFLTTSLWLGKDLKRAREAVARVTKALNEARKVVEPAPPDQSP